MNAKALVCALLSVLISSAAERLEVVICNTDHVPESVLASAELNAGEIFRDIGVDVLWSSCTRWNASPSAERLFILRIRSHTKPASRSGVLGMTYFSSGAPPVYADVYFDNVENLVSAYDVGPAQVAGYAIAHELGHLLLGPTHTGYGVMKAVWSGRDLRIMGHHGLTFDKAQRASIRRQLQVGVRGSP